MTDINTKNIPTASAIPVNENTNETNIGTELQNIDSKKYPDSLTILINTRVRGYPKLKYEPKMSVPGIKSDTVYFDPVIKLNEGIASKVPRGYPPSELFTQFFDRGGFDSLINRTISGSWLGQKIKTLEQAKQDGYIDHNINVTLKQLFKPNNIFYIKDQPYTIYNYQWKKGDWQVGTKSYETRFYSMPYGQGIGYGSYGSYGYGVSPYQISAQSDMLAEQELVQFKELHPDSWKGNINPSASKFNENGHLDDVGRGQQDTSATGNETLPVIPTDTQPDLTDVRVNPDLTNNLSQEVQEVINNADVFMANSFFQPDVPSIVNDPFTISILFSQDRNFKEFLKANSDDEQLQISYDKYSKSFSSFKRNVDKYTVLLGLVNLNTESEEDIEKKEDALGRINKNNSVLTNKLTELVNEKSLFMNIFKTNETITTTAVSLDDSQQQDKAVFETFLEKLKSFTEDTSTYVTQIDNISSNLISKQNVDPSKIVEVQIKLLGTAKKIKVFQTNIFSEASIDNNMNIGVKQYINNGLTDEQKMELENINNNLQEKVVELFNKISKLNSEIQSENYDWLSASSSSITSVVTLQTRLGKSIDQYNMLCQQNIKDGNNARILAKQETTPIMIALKKVLRVRLQFLNTYKDLLTTLKAMYIDYDIMIQNIISFYDFLLELKKKKHTEYSDKKDPNDSYAKDLIFIEMSIINFDIYCYEHILKNDSAYFSLMKQYNTDISEMITSIDKEINETIDPSSILILTYSLPVYMNLLKQKYMFYINEIFININKRDTTISRIIDDATHTYIEKKITDIKTLIKTAFKLNTSYNNNYTDSEKKELLAQVTSGTTKTQSTNILQVTSFKKWTSKSKNSRQLDEYYKMIESQSIAYEWLSIFAKLHHIGVSRHITTLTFERSLVTHELTLEKELYTKYYNPLLEKNYVDLDNTFVLIYIFNLRSVSSIQNRAEFIEEKMKSCENNYRDNIYKKKRINIDIMESEDKYNELTDRLIPNLTDIGINETCKELYLNEPEIVVPGQKRMNQFFKDFFRYENEDITAQFQDIILPPLLSSCVDSKFTKKMSPSKLSSLIDNWSIVGSATDATSFETAIINVLNGQMIIMQKISVNKYSEAQNSSTKPEQYMFSLASMNNNNNKNMADIVVQDLKINIIKINMYQEAKIKKNSYVQFYDENKFKNTIGIVKKVEIPNNSKSSIKDFTSFKSMINGIYDLINLYKTPIPGGTRINNYQTYVDFFNCLLSLVEHIKQIQNYDDNAGTTIQIFEELKKILDDINSEIRTNGNKPQTFNIEDNKAIINMAIMASKITLPKYEVISYVNDSIQKYNISLWDINLVPTLFYHIDDVDKLLNQDNEYTMFLLCDNRESDSKMHKYYNIYEQGINNPFMYNEKTMPVFFKYMIFRDLVVSFTESKIISPRTFDKRSRLSRNIKKYLENRVKNIPNSYKEYKPANLLLVTNNCFGSSRPRRIGGGENIMSGGDPQSIISQYKRPIDYRMDALYGKTDSKLSFYIIIDLELYPGADGIPIGQKAVLACQNRYEKIRQAWAKIFGLVYRPKELDVVGHVAPSNIKYKKKKTDTQKIQEENKSGGKRRFTRRRKRE